LRFGEIFTGCKSIYTLNMNDIKRREQIFESFDKLFELQKGARIAASSMSSGASQQAPVGRSLALEEHQSCKPAQHGGPHRL
jgi:ABC-type branched-subunit amino acid transport system ATPase component